MIAIGSDHGGYRLKEEVKKYLDEMQIKYKKLLKQYKIKNVNKEY